jgi:hypothetical protein
MQALQYPPDLPFPNEPLQLPLPQNTALQLAQRIIICLLLATGLSQKLQLAMN